MLTLGAAFRTRSASTSSAIAVDPLRVDDSSAKPSSKPPRPLRPEPAADRLTIHGEDQRPSRGCSSMVEHQPSKLDVASSSLVARYDRTPRRPPATRDRPSAIPGAPGPSPFASTARCPEPRARHSRKPKTRERIPTDGGARRDSRTRTHDASFARMDENRQWSWLLSGPFPIFVAAEASRGVPSIAILGFSGMRATRLSSIATEASIKPRRSGGSPTC